MVLDKNISFMTTEFREKKKAGGIFEPNVHAMYIVQSCQGITTSSFSNPFDQHYGNLYEKRK